MMVVRRREGTWEHRSFRELPSILGPEYFLVLNNTRVFPARLRANRPGRHERIEVLLVSEQAPGTWLCLVRPGSKVLTGQELEIDCLHAKVLETRESGRRILRFNRDQDLMSLIERLGEPPLPPYIHRKTGWDKEVDKDRYQTVYAKRSGSIAAPTAGLHFTQRIIEELESRGNSRCEIVLHVGYGTFQPVRCESIEEHRMDPEYFEVSDDAASFIVRSKSEGRRLLAVGTTTTRVLEYLALGEGFNSQGRSGFCDLFIRPGFEFRMIDSLLTNFHLPRSTLLMLVSAFAGRELMLACYRDAVVHNYRFFSYGDCMLIL